MGRQWALFGEMDEAAIGEIEKKLVRVKINSGQNLFQQGDRSDGAYIVVAGRLRIVVSTPAGGEKVIDESGPGEWLGEMSVISGAPRSATVYAVRDTELLFAPQAVFDELVLARPTAMQPLARVLVDRLQRQIQVGAETHVSDGHTDGREHASLTIALVPLDTDADLDWLGGALLDALSPLRSVTRISAKLAEETLGADVVSAGTTSARGGEADAKVTRWLFDVEATHGVVLYDASGHEAWRARVLRHADHIVYVASGRKAPRSATAPEPMGPESPRAPRRSLALLHRTAHASVSGTAEWLSRLQIDEHEHVRVGDAKDVARLARGLVGRGIGVALGGGGSRGYGHIGVLRAIAEAGIPIDRVGGTSMGGVIAIAHGMGWAFSRMFEVVPRVMKAGFFDPTLPMVSLMSGERLMRALEPLVGSAVLEDLVTPTFAVATSLSLGEPVVFDRGSIALALRATGSVPGILPPVPWNGDLLVDGGLSANVPVNEMRRPRIGHVIAVDVVPSASITAGTRGPLHVSGWTYIRARVRREAPQVPDIVTTLIQSAMVSSRGLGATSHRRRADLYLQPEISRWNLADFGQPEQVAEEAYQSTRRALAEWWRHSRVLTASPRDSAPP